MLSIHRNIRPFSYWGLLFIILLVQGCSIPKPSPYHIENPVMLAYRHDMSLASLERFEQSDSFGVLDFVDGGFVLNTSSQDDNSMYSLWINDSLLILKVNFFVVEYFEHISKTSSKVRYEAKLRKQRPLLVYEVIERLSQESIYFGNPSVIRELLRDKPQYSYAPIPFQISADSLTIVDHLHWSSTAFGDSMSIHFEKGIMHGKVRIRDTTKQVMKVGNYQRGFEEGIWQIYDLNKNRLQWEEDWKRGELQKVNYSPEAFLEREPPLPTLRWTIILHRCVFYGALLSGIVVLFFYIRSFRNFSPPYDESGPWEILGKLIVSPFLTAGTIALFIFLLSFVFTILQKTLGWDVPGDFERHLMMIVFYFLVGTLYFISTFRIEDTLWHSALLTVFHLLSAELAFLNSLEVGII